MANIQISAENRLRLLQEHQVWLAQLPRRPGQIGSEIVALVEGPPIYVPGEISTYSDFEPVRFMSVDERFLEHLHAVGIPFRED